MNKASGGDGIPVELFQILNDDAVEVPHSICQPIWKSQQWPQDWKMSAFISIPKKGNAKQAGFRKGRGKRDQTANICWIMEKARKFQK